jgi:hypothetical protein
MNPSKILRNDVTLLTYSFKLRRHIGQGCITAPLVVLNRGVAENSGILIYYALLTFRKIFSLIKPSLYGVNSPKDKPLF